MRNGADYILKLKPWSLSTFMAAFLAVVFAATMQEVLASFGATLYFAAFFPAILMASLLGGVPAGIFAAVLAIPIVWWAFMPPIFEFNPLTPADYDSFAIFLLCSSLLICFSHLYREALAIRTKFPVESDITGRLPN
jgi:H+/Cl- antiporter ClcA